MRKLIFSAACLLFLPALALAQPAAQGCGDASAPVGVRAGASFQIYMGATPQVYRVCKRSAVPAREDCDVEVTSAGKRVALLEKQPINTCSCVDADGTNIEARTLPAGASCGSASSTIWYENLRAR